MKLKIIDISISNLLKLTNRFLHLNIINNGYDEKKLKHISIDYIRENIDIPIVIFLKNESNFIDRQVITADGIGSLYSTISVDINDILNVNQLMIYKVIYENGFKQELQKMQTKIIFIERESVGSSQNIILLTQLLLLSKNNTNIIDTKLLDNIFTKNDKKMLKNKFALSIPKHFFPQKRKASSVKNKIIKNPWLYLYQKRNQKYLSLKDKIRKPRNLKIIHCPICAKTHKITTKIVYLKADILHFNCSHSDTQFAKYMQFSINVNMFQTENFVSAYAMDLVKFFKYNIQPLVINNVYVIKILLSNKTEYLPLKIFFKKPQINNISINDMTSILKEFYCPICSKKHLINFTNINQEDYIDINGNKYIHYENKFQKVNNKLEFTCDHEDTSYEIYNHFSKKYIKTQTFIEQSLSMVHTCFGNYLDGKKVAYIIVNDEPFIIDLANFI